MIIVLEGRATESEVGAVVKQAERLGSAPSVSRAGSATVVRVRLEHAKPTPAQAQSFRALPGVRDVMEEDRPYVLASREFKQTDTLVRVRDVTFGAKDVILIAGPCAVESREQIFAIGRAVKAAGGRMLRGGAFKPRTSPYTFQGLGEEALTILAEAREETGLPLVTELMDPRHVEAVVDTVDVIQIGARNMSNFALLAEVGRARKPVLLKRGLSATLEELLMAAEYVVKEGNSRVILCERGIKTFETAMRFTLDIGAVPVLKQETHLPVIVDPSHAAGRRDLVLPLARAAVAAGADGIIVEVHPVPEEALCDGPQQIPAAEFEDFASEIRALCSLMGRVIG